MNILVLGGNGFIGSHVVNGLLVSGHKVRVLDRYPKQHREWHDKVDYRAGDFGDAKLIAGALMGIDAVCHLISTSIPSTSNLDPAEDIQSNLINSVRLLEQMRISGCKRIIYLSSGGTVYGIPNRVPITECHPLNPICSYGVVKIAVEKYLHMYQKLYGFSTLVLRPSNPYGPGQSQLGLQGLIGTFLGKVLTGDPLEIWGDGEIIRDYIYIDDVTSLVVSALESDVTGVFNLGSGQGYSVKQITEIMRSMSQSDVIVNYRDARAYDVPEVVLDIEKTMRIFDWKPETGVQEGIQRHFEWALRQYDKPK